MDKSRKQIQRYRDNSRFRVQKTKSIMATKLLLDGVPTTDPSIIMQSWLNHFRNLFKSETHSIPGISAIQDQIPLLTNQSMLNCDVVLDVPFSGEEIEHAVRRLRSGKVSGINSLVPENIKHAGPSLIVWLRQIFIASIELEHIPQSLLTGIICPIFKGKGKNLMICDSYRGITLLPVILKVFEYAVLKHILPVLSNAHHPLLTQTAYQKRISCQDAIFASQEVLISMMRDGGHPVLSLYDLEKAYDSIEHAVLLKALFEAGVSGKAWRIVKAFYGNLQAIVNVNFTSTAVFPILRGVQQGSVLSPTFFLVIMDKLLHSLKHENVGVSICSLYLGGAAHSDNVRTIETSTQGATEQSKIVSKFASDNGLKLNASKTEIVRFLTTSSPPLCSNITIDESSLPILSQASCLGYCWSSTLSPTPAIQENTAKARRQLFALGSSGVFLVMQIQSAPKPCLKRVFFLLCCMVQRIGFLTIQIYVSWRNSRLR